MDEGQLLVANLFDFAACQITLRLAGGWSVDSLANLLSIRLLIALIIPIVIPLVACLAIDAALGAIDLGGARGLRL